MNTKKYLAAMGYAFLIGIVIMPSVVFAEDIGKIEKPLDSAVVDAQVASLDAKARDVLPSEYPDGYLAQRLGAMQRSTKVTKSVIQDTSNLPLGRIKNLLVDLNQAKVYCALMSLEGTDYVVAVPGKSFYPGDNSNVILGMTKEALKQAPHFSTADRKSISESYAYFNQRPFWNEKTGPGDISQSSDFIGMPVRDKNNEDLGKVIDLMVDLPTARIIFAIISYDGSEQNVYAVPPVALMLTSDKKVLFLDDSRAKISERAHPNNYFWTEMTDRTWAANLYQTYGVKPDFDTKGAQGADLTREQVRAKVEDSPANKAAGKTDSEITRMILTSMVREDLSNAFNHKNIKINTVSGRVTLSGRVKNDRQKDKLTTIAEGVVGAGNVDNQLEIR